MSSTVVYDPTGVVTGGLPLDRDPHLALAAAVLARGPNPVGVRAADCAQIGLQLTGHARCVAADLRQRFEALPADSELRPLTKAVLREAVNRLSTGPATTTARVQNRARLIGPLPGTRPTRHHTTTRAGHLITGSRPRRTA
ncbi:restriction endonuclease [Streptomyces sp. McG3]|uniref:restriction endonuclease n=1 Tax=Streptomyces sp. McG3 TaxID=2725483 RepID=UPI00203765F5|nr:restriction endonuclease [Streptomyces sp. McG3]